MPPKKKAVSVVSIGATNVVIPESDKQQKPSSKVEDSIDYLAKLLLAKLNHELDHTKEALEIEKEDVDAENRGNPFYCTDYVKEIFCYLRELEVSTAFVLKATMTHISMCRGCWLPRLTTWL